MFKILKEVNKPRKLVNEEISNAEKQNKIEDFFNLIICLTSITRMLSTKEIQDKYNETIETQKQILISAVDTIAKAIGLEDELGQAEMKEKEIKEAFKPVERYEFDVIPQLRFYEIQANLNTIIEGYTEIGDKISYEKTCEIATDLTRIENAIDNIATAISNELKINLINKE